MVVLLIAAIVSIVRGISRSHDDSTAVVPEDDTSLITTNIPDTRVEIVVRGPLVADENFASYRVSISQSERVMNVYRGYQKELVESRTLPNNDVAFRQFIEAIDKQNFTRDTGAEVGDSLDGVCAIGQVVTFNVYKNGDLAKMLWTSTCNGAPGNFGGNLDRIRLLFSLQIPDFNSLIRDTEL
jgi:hypothetical protein